MDIDFYYKKIVDARLERRLLRKATIDVVAVWLLVLAFITYLIYLMICGYRFIISAPVTGYVEVSFLVIILSIGLIVIVDRDLLKKKEFNDKTFILLEILSLIIKKYEDNYNTFKLFKLKILYNHIRSQFYVIKTNLDNVFVFDNAENQKKILEELLKIRSGEIIHCLKNDHKNDVLELINLLQELYGVFMREKMFGVNVNVEEKNEKYNQLLKIIKKINEVEPIKHEKNFSLLNLFSNQKIQIGFIFIVSIALIFLMSTNEYTNSILSKILSVFGVSIGWIFFILSKKEK